MSDKTPEDIEMKAREALEALVTASTIDEAEWAMSEIEAPILALADSHAQLLAELMAERAIPKMTQAEKSAIQKDERYWAGFHKGGGGFG